ncbi:hypothetical protein ABW16_11555 [Mycolicibacter heraklionensis]|uniref:Phosphoglycerate mutase n=1 Tax=Mycolicibacter heraklionensis TaxID=512402 RepID=A0ABR5FF63_9MYCO|nr:histidine phosphatase family protein [Mycolicibacter heraklionensis]KLO28759.1 hypothetical protein ABW16_11555 [Mycolicibacter heraklionensis]
MSQHVIRPWATAIVALAGTGVIAVAPAATPLPDVQNAMLQLAADADILLNFVRHGESTDNVNLIDGTVVPGAPLTELGQQQAQNIATELLNSYGSGGVDGIYSAQLLRALETAAPFAALEGLTVQELSGLNEINVGVFEGFQASSQSEYELVGALVLLAPFLWTLGLQSVPLLGSSDYNGMAFDARFSDAVQAIYDAGGPNHVDVAFSSAAATMVWTMMNVDNPDPLLILQHPLPNTAQVVIEGSPTDGWTLISWDGMPVPAADLATQLFVDFRDLIVAPQTASYQIQAALLSSDPTTIINTIQTAFTDVLTALGQFPQSVISDIIDALNAGVADTAVI